MRARSVTIALLLGVSAIATPAHAQFLSSFDTDLVLEVSPLNPLPGDSTRVSARSLLLDLSTLEVEWYVNGTKVNRGVGLSHVDTTAGPLGSEVVITAAVFEDGYERIRQDVYIRPTELDVLWDSDSYTPPLYRGRALPTAGTTLYFEAVPRFMRRDRSLMPLNDIVFTWRKDGYVVAEASGRGKSKATFESSGLSGISTIAVDARSVDGSLANSASVRIPSTEPMLVLYEDHPLFGVMYHAATPERSFHSEVELTFAAVPYFAAVPRADDPRLQYEWRVNGTPITNNPERPSAITVDARGSSGLARLELALSHATNFFMSSFGSWTMTLLSSQGPAGTTDPFSRTQ